ncbi:hypothetical protein [Flavobacterium sp.]|jgi:hypothetical protein|uniref:hypothetical protein n=1 Tax=Flavobacterium sp. TaxID=239 RepID=UPI0037C0E2DF
MKITKFGFFLLLVFQISFGQTSDGIPKGFTKIEGLEYVGKITFYLEKKTQTILAYQNGKVKWKAAVMKVCGKPSVGKSEIREIRIENKGLKIVYGKHSFANIEAETGKVICEGQD